MLLRHVAGVDGPLKAISGAAVVILIIFIYSPLKMAA